MKTATPCLPWTLSRWKEVGVVGEAGVSFDFRGGDKKWGVYFCVGLSIPKW